MGAQEEHDQVIGGKGGKQVEALQTEVEELKEFYKKLKQQNDSHTRSIVGLTTEKEDVRKRIRALLNKRTAAEGPDFDEYQIHRRVSRQYEPIDHQRKKSTTGKKTSITSEGPSDTQTSVVVEEIEPKPKPVSVTVTVKAN